MNSALLRVLRTEGLSSALQRASERRAESWQQQAKLVRGIFQRDRQAALLNVIGMAPVARLGGVPIQLRARLHHEQAQRRVALYAPSVLEVGMGAWSVRDLSQAVTYTQARVLHLEGTFGLSLTEVLRHSIDIVLSLHDLSLLDEPRELRVELLQRAKAIVFPSEYLRQRYEIDGPVIAPGSPATAVTASKGLRQRIAYVGSIKRHKGAHLLPELIKATQAQCDSVEWHVFGGGDEDLIQPLQALPGVSVHGYYRAAALPALLAKHRIGLAVLPSIVPESFGLALSECWCAGVPALAFAHGAYAERIGREGGGWLVSLAEGAAGMAATIDAWLCEKIKAPVPNAIPTPRDSAGAYLDLYRSLGVI